MYFQCIYNEHIHIHLLVIYPDTKWSCLFDDTHVNICLCKYALSMDVHMYIFTRTSHDIYGH